jgi:hypothetical protein
MAFIRYNENPYKNDTIDCAIRAISTFLDMSWDDVYIDLSVEGFINKDMPNKNYIWDQYLKRKGLQQYLVPNTCPNCTTVKQFTDDHRFGKYLLGTGSHVIAVINGNHYDTWDSGQELPLYYYKREINEQ